MAAETIHGLLNRTTTHLERLRIRYEGLGLRDVGLGGVISNYLGERERRTIRAIRGWVLDNAPAGSAWVRLPAIFPFVAPPLPRLDASPAELLENAATIDEHLTVLVDSVENFVAAVQPRETLAALRTILHHRRAELGAATFEHELGTVAAQAM